MLHGDLSTKAEAISDFFGDGTRIPLIVVSPWVSPGHISHDYADHVSIIKFIERNWTLPTITNRSRDNFPNPKVAANNPYVATNGPAISDLFDASTSNSCKLQCRPFRGPLFLSSRFSIRLLPTFALTLYSSARVARAIRVAPTGSNAVAGRASRCG
jgi:hypothetical protein